MEKVVVDFLSLRPPFATLLYMTQVHEKNKGKEFHLAIKKYLLKRDYENKEFYYLITFTLNEEHKNDDEVKVYNYIKSRLRRPALQIVKAHLVMEHTKQGIPHYHASVISKKFISKDRFKYYVKKFGYIDISKSHHKDYRILFKYISKEALPHQIIGLD